MKKSGMLSFFLIYEQFPTLYKYLFKVSCENFIMMDIFNRKKPISFSMLIIAV